jgi:putative membrane protein
MKKTDYPKWIYKFLSKSEIDSVSEIVALSEKTTSGEIVPLIVRRSSSIRHLPMLLTSLFLILFFILNGHETLIYEFKIHFFNSLSIIGPYISLILVTVIFYIISLKLSEFMCVQRFFISKVEQSENVHKRAFLEFYLNHVTQTEFKTGILIFISLMERQTVVLGDETISKKLPAETWQEIVDLIIKSVQHNKTAEGLKSAIEKCGQILSQHFPEQSKNPNELDNQLIIKD